MNHLKRRSLPKDINALCAGDDGSTLVLLPGWPETAEAYADISAALSERHRMLILDPPGLGDSGPSAQGYDTGTIGRLLAEAVANDGVTAYHLVGHDVGAWIAYAWAAQFPDHVKSLTLLDSAVPGCSAPRTFPLTYEVNLKLWQFSFNTLPELPEILTDGKERELLNWLFDKKASYPKRITPERRDRYIEKYSRPGAMSRGFAYYRAVARSAEQNRGFSLHKLPMPVLALGGETAVGDSLRLSLEPLAEMVEGGVIADCGHYLMEEQPAEVSTRMLEFFDRVDGGHA